MRLLLIGAPGAGKGTQAERLAERFGIEHISSGDLLRQHVREQTSIGQTIRAYVDAGDLVPDAVVMDMLRKPVVTAAESCGYVLDGFPRTVDQAKAAFEIASALGVEVQAAVHLDVPDEQLIRRLLARSRASDDSEEVIAHRLQVYREDRPAARVLRRPGVDVHRRRRLLPRPGARGHRRSLAETRRLQHRGHPRRRPARGHGRRLDPKTDE